MCVKHKLQKKKKAKKENKQKQIINIKYIARRKGETKEAIVETNKKLYICNKNKKQQEKKTIYTEKKRGILRYIYANTKLYLSINILTTLAATHKPS